MLLLLLVTWPPTALVATRTAGRTSTAHARMGRAVLLLVVLLARVQRAVLVAAVPVLLLVVLALAAVLREPGRSAAAVAGIYIFFICWGFCWVFWLISDPPKTLGKVWCSCGNSSKSSRTLVVWSFFYQNRSGGIQRIWKILIKHPPGPTTCPRISIVENAWTISARKNFPRSSQILAIHQNPVLDTRF